MSKSPVLALLMCSFELVPSPALCCVLSNWKLQKGISCLVLLFLVHQLCCYNYSFSAVYPRTVVYIKIPLCVDS